MFQHAYQWEIERKLMKNYRRVREFFSTAISQITVASKQASSFNVMVRMSPLKQTVCIASEMTALLLNFQGLGLALYLDSVMM